MTALRLLKIKKSGNLPINSFALHKNRFDSYGRPLFLWLIKGKMINLTRNRLTGLSFLFVLFLIFQSENCSAQIGNKVIVIAEVKYFNEGKILPALQSYCEEHPALQLKSYCAHLQVLVFAVDAVIYNQPEMYGQLMQGMQLELNFKNDITEQQLMNMCGRDFKKLLLKNQP